jgi:hypothetical protein
MPHITITCGVIELANQTGQIAAIFNRRTDVMTLAIQDGQTTYKSTALRLGTVLRADAIFSTASAGLLVGLSGPVSALMGLADYRLAMVILGLGLLPWAWAHWMLARQNSPKRQVKMLVWGDAAWVLASAEFLYFFQETLTSFGFWSIIAVAVIVGEFGVTKYLLARKAD